MRTCALRTKPKQTIVLVLLACPSSIVRLITHMAIKHQFTENLHRRRFLLISIASHHWYIDCLYSNVSFTVHIIYALRGAYFILKFHKFQQYFYVMLFQPGFLIE